MSRNPSGAVTEQISILFRLGMLANVTDGQLLDRFMQGTKEEAEASFEALVERHGPMVLRVCQQQIGDPHDAQDAFQAVFLVLARSPHLIRNRNSVGSWLHGVALRTSSRLLLDAGRRRAAERKGALNAAERVLDARSDADRSWSDIHTELSRLPERYRAPIILCYLEGRSHEEAAAELAWPLGTLKTRLNRGRERLKSRLVRKGLAPTAEILMPTGSAWFPAAEKLARTTVGVLSATASGGTGAGLVPAFLISRAEEVVWTMFLSKVKSLGLMLLLGGFVVAGIGSVLVRASSDSQPASAPALGEAAPSDPQSARFVLGKGSLAIEMALHDLEKARLASARKRFEVQKAFYEEGRISIDRYVDSSRTLLQAESDASSSIAERVEAARRHLERIVQIEVHELAEIDAGRATLADVEEARSSRLDAEYHLMKMLKESEASTHPASPVERNKALAPVGAANPPQPRLLKIRPRFECVIEEVLVKVGQPVRKGDVLFNVFSAELATVKNEYRPALSSSSYFAKRLAIRSQQAETGAISQQQFLDTQRDEEKSRLACESARDRLEIFGLNAQDLKAIPSEPGEQKARLSIKAPADGTITKIEAEADDLVDMKNILLILQCSVPHK